jgi:hypothetical protein
VQASTPSILHPYPDDWPRDRLGFARWLVSADNPLTARVVVNRQWAALFSRGIVSTVADFGTQGEPPSHPHLLDWLAVELMEQGWSLKKLHKLMIMSATYRQSSRLSEQLKATDPLNRWLARAPRPRLEGEIIRDVLLAASGLLTSQRGGPGVRPPQPEGVTEVAYGKPAWNPSSGERRYRRSVYTFVKRTAPFAMYNTFDGPSGEGCVARRDVSNTPLQALTLLNDGMLTEAAQALGQVLADYEGDDRNRACYAFRRLLARPPTSAEADALVDFVQKQRKRIVSGELDARQISGNPNEDAVEPATWTTLARALFSLDETITRN